MNLVSHKCKDYNYCKGCPYLSMVNIIVEDDDGNKHNKIITLCEYNGKIDKL